MSAEPFALNAAAAHGEVWRLWTGHIVHYDLAHLVTNTIAVGVPLALVDRWSRRAILLAMIVIAPAISIVLLAGARFDEYRGASGLALAIWIAASLSLLRSGTAHDRRTGGVLLILALAKLAAEMAGTGHVWQAIAPLPLAHFAGALAGLLAFVSLQTRGTPASSPSRGARGSECAIIARHETPPSRAHSHCHLRRRSGEAAQAGAAA